jgi:hypothetical protein
VRIINIENGAATFALDPRDCIQLADACGYAINHDIRGDHHLLEALGAALTSAAMAAFALDHGAVEEGEYTMAGLRAFWAPLDSACIDARKVLVPPQ